MCICVWYMVAVIHPYATRSHTYTHTRHKNVRNLNINEQITRQFTFYNIRQRQRQHTSILPMPGSQFVIICRSVGRRPMIRRSIFFSFCVICVRIVQWNKDKEMIYYFEHIFGKLRSNVYGRPPPHPHPFRRIVIYTCDRMYWRWAKKLKINDETAMSWKHPYTTQKSSSLRRIQSWIFEMKRHWQPGQIQRAPVTRMQFN